MIAPCKCTGSVKYIHFACFKKWLQALYSKKDKKEQQKLLENGANCELCKEKIELNIGYKCICASPWSAKEKITRSPFFFILFLFFIMLGLGLLSYLVAYTKNNASTFQNIVVALLIGGSYLFLIIALVVVVYHFIILFFVDKVWFLQSVKM
jgi:hypothetical protein